MQKSKKFCLTSITFLVIFVLWTMLVKFVDVRPIGPNQSSVGFSLLNGLFHNFTGVNLSLYTITDILSVIPFSVCFVFGLIGLRQLITRKSFKKIDYDILMLGIYYIVVICLYLLFEKVIINYRPILINGLLEVSYPSSTTLLVVSVMPTAIIQTSRRIKCSELKLYINTLLYIFTIFMIGGRLISGVHWITDIIGGLLLSFGLLFGYVAIITQKE